MVCWRRLSKKQASLQDQQSKFEVQQLMNSMLLHGKKKCWGNMSFLIQYMGPSDSVVTVWSCFPEI